MKKSYRFSVLFCMTVLLASCVGKLGTDKIAVNIEFRPVIGYDTRVEESVPFPEDRSFSLWAQNPMSGQMYVDSETISYNGTWTSEKMWPEHPVGFQACWPLDLPVSYSNAKGLQIKGFDSSRGDVDVLIAKADSESQVDGKVVLPFNHALSRVEFRMRHSLSEEMAVRVTKIVLKGFAQTGDYNTQKSYGWSCTDYNASRVIFEAPEGSPAELQGGEVLYVGTDFFAIPQISASMLQVYYEVRFEDANWIPQMSELKSLALLWEAGKHYTYTLNLGMDKLVCTTGISSWNNRE